MTRRAARLLGSALGAIWEAIRRNGWHVAMSIFVARLMQSRFGWHGWWTGAGLIALLMLRDRWEQEHDDSIVAAMLMLNRRTRAQMSDEPSIHPDSPLGQVLATYRQTAQSIVDAFAGEPKKETDETTP